MGIQNILQNIKLSLLNVDNCSLKNWNYQKVTSPFTRIYFINGGEGRIIHNHKQYDLRPGNLYLIPSYTLCNYRSDTFLDHIYVHFTIQTDLENNLFDLLDFASEIPVQIDDERLIKRIVELNPDRKLHDVDPIKYSKDNLLPRTEILNNTNQLARFIETQGILMQLLSRFIKTEDEHNHVLKYNQSKPISKATNYIHNNLSKQLTISELAALCHLSNDYFSRLFVIIIGTRPVDYINRKRIEMAQLQLITTDDKVEKIALKNGVDNFSYFNRMFKKYACSTPGEYRRLHRLV